MFLLWERQSLTRESRNSGKLCRKLRFVVSCMKFCFRMGSTTDRRMRFRARLTAALNSYDRPRYFEASSTEAETPLLSIQLAGADDCDHDCCPCLRFDC